MSSSENTTELQPARDGAVVAPDLPDEPRISRLSGKTIEPIRRKPEIKVEVVLKNEFNDAEGPIARRAVPRTTPVDAQPANDADLRVLERATTRDDRAERDAVEAAKTQLRSTCLANAKAAADAAAAWAVEHKAYFERLE